MRNPMKMSVGFLKAEPNRTELSSKFKTRKLSFCSSFLKKPTLAVWGQFFTLSHSQFIFLHDRINSQKDDRCWQWQTKLKQTKQ